MNLNGGYISNGLSQGHVTIDLHVHVSHLVACFCTWWLLVLCRFVLSFVSSCWLIVHTLLLLLRYEDMQSFK